MAVRLEKDADTNGREPQMRGTYLRANLHAVRSLGADVEARVLARLGNVAAQVEQSDDWAPCAWDVALSEAIAAEAGINAVRDVNRDAFVAQFHGPLLGPIFLAATRVFGISPRAILKVARAAWTRAVRDAGILDIDLIDEHQAAVRWTGAHPSSSAKRTSPVFGACSRVLFNLCARTATSSSRSQSRAPSCCA